MEGEPLNGVTNISRVPTKHKDAVTYKLAVLAVDGQNNQFQMKHVRKSLTHPKTQRNC